MSCCADEDFWENLLTLIEERTVIPVVGEGAVTVGDPPTRLTTWLARQLAATLLKKQHKLPEQPSLNQVVAAHRLEAAAKGESGQNVYTRIKRLLENSQAPQAPLLDLARVTHFNLFLTTAFDPLLKDALNHIRHSGDPLTRLITFHPGATEKDLPVPKKDLGTTLYYVLGHFCGKPDYAVWDEDVLEFVLELHRLLLSPDAPNLSEALQENSLLFLGCNFSDWLARFFIRVAEQRQFSDTSRKRIRVVADGPTPIDGRLVMFFNSATKDTHIISCSPAEFATELYTRWADQFPQAVLRPTPVQASFEWPSKDMPADAVFISYCRADLEAAKCLKQGLQTAGCPVWFDQDRLEAGENWENTLEKEVKTHCALFLSVISRNSESRPGYCQKERIWANDRSATFGNLGGFYLPVFVDETKDTDLKFEPLPKTGTNSTRLPGGKVNEKFITRVKNLRKRNMEYPRR